MKNQNQQGQSKKANLVNEEIRFPRVMLIASDGASLGITEIKEAQRIAYDQDLDLVCLNKDANPPVCKILDYSKYLFEKNKKEREAKKNQKNAEVKEVQISPLIADNDFNLKQKQARKFLERGDKVKVTLLLKKKYLPIKDKAQQRVLEFVEGLSDVSFYAQKDLNFDGKIFVVVLQPKKTKSSK